MHTVVILAKTRGQTPTNTTTGTQITNNTYFDLAATPPTPLRIGQRARVLAVREVLSHRITRGIEPGGQLLIAEDVDVEGTIIAARPLEPQVTELILRNDDPMSTTDFAYISVPHSEGVTVNLPLLWRVLRWAITSLLPATRTVLLQDDLDVRWPE
ncbi:hypothetical protein ONZ51_g2660 [Trametes cubensis]|uniref:Uncharacterized protein n=1 Tax=Trametes cubensis TaxID=1111947 RepID=A0AAD7U1T4_9APHY|nr:hypothetical protein ONZ51_g2660 [Trametes cubensis]